MMLIKNDEQLQSAQVMISEFLVLHSPIDALVLEVAVNEALNNGYYSSGRVGLKLKRVGKKLIIRVKDYGQGFNTRVVNVHLEKDLCEKEFEEMLEEESGRGILLMKIFFDRVIYNVKGNEVLLMKKIP